MVAQKLISRKTELFGRVLDALAELEPFIEPGYNPSLKEVFARDNYESLQKHLSSEVLPKIAAEERVTVSTVSDKLTRRMGLRSITDFLELVVGFLVAGENKLEEVALAELPHKTNKAIHDNDVEYLSDLFREIRAYKEGEAGFVDFAEFIEGLKRFYSVLEEPEETEMLPQHLNQ